MNIHVNLFILRYIEHSLTISININIDGIPLFKSSKLQFWPILFNISEMPEIAPMTIAIFHGKTKPISLDDFLNQLVEELIDVLNHGVIINNFKIHVKLRCFICDSPARAFLKGLYMCNWHRSKLLNKKKYRCCKFQFEKWMSKMRMRRRVLS